MSSELWLLGDQLDHAAAPLSDADRALPVESHGFAGRRPHHSTS